MSMWRSPFLVFLTIMALIMAPGNIWAGNAQSRRIKTTTLAPHWIFYQRLVATIGLDRSIKISQMETINDRQYSIDITVDGHEEKKVLALATLLAKSRDFTGVAVDISVKNGSGVTIQPQPFPKRADDAADLIFTALNANPHFAAIQRGNPNYTFFVEFRKEVTQFPANMNTDSHHMANEVAAEAFCDILDFKNIRTHNIGVSTALNDPTYELPLYSRTSQSEKSLSLQ